MITRREFLSQAARGAALAAAGTAGAGSLSALAAREGKPIEITVYKSPSCGCCSKWVDHLKGNGFTVTARDLEDVDEVKASLGVPASLASCHTGVVAGYVVEGHVPAPDIKRLLAQRPKVAGIAVPGMPMGSPGMEGTRRDRYDVVSFDRAGRTRVFASH